jgi:uncharacterized repeat protein (TIGR02543 family)
MTLYAVWEANTYAVSFSANGGESTMSSQTFTHGVEQALSANAFTREGYTFAGWATRADGEVDYTARQSISVSTSMTLYAVWEQATYIVLDLSGGTSAASYPVTNLSDVPAGGWTDEYKTTKLVLRKITAGKMPRTDVDITLTKDYYVGVFEVTQKQYELVTGNKPSEFSGDTLPVEQVSWNAIRGDSGTHNWPEVKTVDANSFMGRLRARTGLTFDLPTEAQWEYACRAGTTTTYYWGDSMNGAYAWYSENSSGETHSVGTRKANAWGLYDMSGNIFELCLDWYGNLSSGSAPVGSSSGSTRVVRGGCWCYGVSYCSSSYRIGSSPSYDYCNLGFRLACSAGL